ncbi:MAG TPA: beta-ketoacyl-ACP synthase III [Nitrospirales bacterium]|nr:beta-ketoacyl-ACP synthase III [Nitrospirales bacterium]
MRRSRIIGTGSYLPSRSVSNDEVGRAVGLDADAVFRRTGIRTRRWAADAEASSDLAAHAARAACAAAGLPPDQLDAIIVSSTSPDMAFPSTGCHLQRALGVRGIPAFDISASCSGFLYALSMADAFIRGGQFQRCLVLAAEIKSRTLDPSDEATAVVFGDGAGAAIVVPDDRADGRHGLLGLRLFADGSRRGLIGIDAGGSRRPATVQTVRERAHALRMHGGPLFRVAVRRLAGAVLETLKEFGVTVDEVSAAVFHQANQRIMDAVVERVGLPPDRLYSVIERFGNTSSASLPIALDHAVREGRIREHDLVLLGTFGGGLTWASGLMRW